MKELEAKVKKIVDITVGIAILLGVLSGLPFLTGAA